jgi:hypothetical protein
MQGQSSMQGGATSGSTTTSGSTMSGTGAMSGSTAPSYTSGASAGMMGGAGIAPQPIAAPEQANPNPPVCKAGQYDDCIQRGASRSRRSRR